MCVDDEALADRCLLLRRWGRRSEPQLFGSKKGDRRFASDAWQTWPFNVMSQSYLMVENWIDSMTQGLPGMEEEHQAVFSFMTSQLLAAMSPSNYPLTNPDVLQAIRDEKGQNLVRGAAKALEEVKASAKKSLEGAMQDAEEAAKQAHQAGVAAARPGGARCGRTRRATAGDRLLASTYRPSGAATSRAHAVTFAWICF